jgi:glycine/D-amino acid oxidase-like deaminating enzyme
MVDYFIVGSGIAGVCFAEMALQNNKSILVIDNDSQNSSKIAGGLYNPVILKRFSEVPNAIEQIKLLDVFYSSIEAKLGTQIDYKIPILRKFFSVEEQNNWFAASDKPNLTPFLSLDLVNTKYDGIDAPFGYGEVLQTGYVDTAKMISNYRSYLIKNTLFQKETFDYNALIINEEYIEYNNRKAKHIIFAEGFGIHSNPFFNNLPLDGTKGELFIIKAPKLVLNVIINTSVFILPLGNGLYKVGATYDWKDKSNQPTEAGRQELIDRIDEILECDYEIIEHFAGVRPTVRDRRPIIGTHKDSNRVHILNGLGTRGVMLGPFLAKILFENIEFGTPIPMDSNSKRFDKKQ